MGYCSCRDRGQVSGPNVRFFVVSVASNEVTVAKASQCVILLYWSPYTQLGREDKMDNY